MGRPDHELTYLLDRLGASFPPSIGSCYKLAHARRIQELALSGVLRSFHRVRLLRFGRAHGAPNGSAFHPVSSCRCLWASWSCLVCWRPGCRLSSRALGTA